MRGLEKTLSLRVIDSHTEGEPTRVVTAGLPILDGAAMMERRRHLQREWDFLRTAITAEPRASEGAVAAFLIPPVAANAAVGVIFANRAGYLGMCGHASIGVVHTLAELGLVKRGDRVTLETPVGNVCAQRFEDGSVEIQNVRSRAYRLDVTLNVPGIGHITGDIAYGGNWFFLVDAQQLGTELALANLSTLTTQASAIRNALRTQGIVGEGNAEIDHVEIFGPPARPDADAKNFVLCPDGAYDRSPCGTGTSAKMAVLAARGRLEAGRLWRQESIIGSLFTGRIEAAGERGVIPFIRGYAYLTSETTLRFDPKDPYRYGIVSP